MKTPFNKKTICIFLLSFSSIAFANKVISVENKSDNPAVNQEVTLAFKFSAPDDAVKCGIQVDWGDGDISKLRFGQDGNVKAPFEIKHIYKAAINAQVSIKGVPVFRGMNSVAGCEGSFNRTIAIADAMNTGAQIQQSNKSDEKTPNLKTDQQAQAKTSVSNDSGLRNFKGVAQFLRSIGTSWRESRDWPERTIFYCYGQDANGKKILNGLEFSYRTNDEKSADGACNNMFVFASKIIPVDNWQKSSTNTLSLRGGTEYIVDGKPTSVFKIGSQNEGVEGAWYLSKLNKPAGLTGRGEINFFSEGIFFEPVSAMPSQGTLTFKGRVGNVGGASIATVDFAKRELIFDAQIKPTTTIYQYKSLTPISFNSEGWFNGKVIKTTILNNGQTGNETVWVNGFLGGKNATVLYGFLGEPPLPKDDAIDFFMGWAN